jgi:hypothetical protein
LFDQRTQSWCPEKGLKARFCQPFTHFSSTRHGLASLSMNCALDPALRACPGLSPDKNNQGFSLMNHACFSLVAVCCRLCPLASNALSMPIAGKEGGQ